MLSTPTANTRKGCTSNMIIVAGMPHQAYTPMLLVTDNATINTPATPNIILLLTCYILLLLLLYKYKCNKHTSKEHRLLLSQLYWPNANAMYPNMNK